MKRHMFVHVQDEATGLSWQIDGLLLPLTLRQEAMIGIRMPQAMHEVHLVRPMHINALSGLDIALRCMQAQRYHKNPYVIYA